MNGGLSTSKAGTGSKGRWALSFADLTLLLLGFFVILSASQNDTRDRALASIRAEFAGTAPPDADPDIRLEASALFTPGEAMLTPAGRQRLTAIARNARTSDATILLSSQGILQPEASGASARRFDAWDLASARIGAVARALAAAGIAPARIRIHGPGMDSNAPAQQIITITTTTLPPAR